MNHHLITTALFACLLQASHATVLVQWDFNENAGTGLTGTANSGSKTGTWEQVIPGVATDGAGRLATIGTNTSTTSASNKSAAGGPGLGITAGSGVYEMTFSDVRFNNLSGDDYLLFGFRTTATGSIVSSSRERANFKVGDFNGTPGLDLEASTAVTPATTYASAYNVTTDFTGAFTFKLWLDTDTNKATAWYDTGSGMVQLGSEYDIVTSTQIDTIALRLIFTDAGGGDSISIGSITVTHETAADPVVPVLAIATSGANLEIICASESGFTYQLQSSSDLGDPWTAVEAQSGSGSDLTFTVPAPTSGQKEFYRVVVPAPAP